MTRGPFAVGTEHRVLYDVLSLHQRLEGLPVIKIPTVNVRYQHETTKTKTTKNNMVYTVIIRRSRCEGRTRLLSTPLITKKIPVVPEPVDLGFEFRPRGYSETLIFVRENALEVHRLPKNLSPFHLPFSYPNSLFFESDRNDEGSRLIPFNESERLGVETRYILSLLL